MRDNQLNDFRLTVDDVIGIARKNGYQIFSYNEYPELIEVLGLEKECRKKDGVTYAIRKNGKIKYMIFFKNELSYLMKIFVILHEIGHIQLKHTYTDCILGKSGNSKNDDEQEHEANRFACEIMAPSCILKKLKVCTADALRQYALLPEEYINMQICALHKYEISYIPERETIKYFKYPLHELRQHRKRHTSLQNSPYIFLIIVALLLLNILLYGVIKPSLLERQQRQGNIYVTPAPTSNHRATASVSSPNQYSKPNI